MEQKRLDDEDNFFGEEFIEEDFVEEPVEEAVKPKKSPAVKAKIHKEAPKKEEVIIEPKIKKEEKREGVIIKPTKEPSVKEPVKVEPLSSMIHSSEEKNSYNGSSFGYTFWKVTCGILIVLLAVAIFTKGFGFSGAAISGTISQSAAEEKVLTYINNNLLLPPYEAKLEKSEDAGKLYKITVSVGGTPVDTYLTKDGQLFFPQGFEVTDASLKEKAPAEASGSDPVKGQANSPVTIIEFSDFQCPSCGSFFKEVLPQLDKEYIQTGKVKLIFRDFPLESHQYAQKAAEAAECAGEQGKFWEMHDMLFTYQPKLDVDSLKIYAKEIASDMAQFNQCLDSGKMAEGVEKDLADGQSYGVTGTPTFFINGKQISGTLPYAGFKAEVEEVLAAAQSSSASTPAEEAEAPESSAKPVASVKEEAIPPAAPGPVEIEMVAKKWLFTPNKVTINRGDKVKLKITPQDLDFTFTLPGYGIEKQVPGATEIEFTADKVGTFEYKCSSCEDWRGMVGTLVVK